MKKLILSLLLVTICAINLHASEYKVEKVHIVTVDATINPATYNYLASSYEKLSSKKGDLYLIKLNTPGGLVTTTKDIITLFGSGSVPVVIWITPEGASATSAGAIISSSAHLLYMSEGTNIGAATPIQINKDIDKASDGRKKAINDLVALVESLAKARGRTPKPFAKMITEAASYDSQTALKDKFIDGIVNSQSDLLEKVHQSSIKILGEKFTLIVKNPKILEYQMDPGQKILNIFANPTTAYLLFIIGAALLYFEFQAPGGVIAGALGALCLIMAAIGFQVLPLNFGAAGLILASFILFLLEIYITSYGILSLAGVAALTIGSLFLFRTDNAYLDLQRPLIYSVVASVVIYIVFVAFVIFRKKPKEKMIFDELSHEGHITDIINEKEGLYQVKIGAEIWKAHCNEKLTVGEQVQVTQEDKTQMILKIQR